MRVVSILLLTLAACGEPVTEMPACTSCPIVEGQYFETRAAQQVKCLDGSTLSISAVAGRAVTLNQLNSALSTSSGLKGVLKQDLTVAFDAFQEFATNVETGERTPGLAFLTGQFGAPDGGGKRELAATFTFVVDATKCRLNAVSKWVPE